ncbi:non-ribosomal peptide synthetase [Natronoglycomyces albus]|uniref:Phenyloxazoline synthase MbtB n=1 Tax=Natronoglycomyces albus TaxID=2811108 RepID=A0A895XU60_9ACTN|nr:non-ribosomal peptide synthetase [Natronoglycomyces albus]QSB06875.1 amino acid adenylation domain-containing protein [Natronoglycomyces albus]
MNTDHVSDLLDRLRHSRVEVSVVDGNLKLEGPRTAMPAALLARLKEHKADVVAYLEEEAAAGSLTPLQRAYVHGRSGMFAVSDIANQTYHEIEGSFDIDRLRESLAWMFTAHSALRLSVVDAQRQFVTDREPPFTVTDLTGVDPVTQRQLRMATRERRSHLVLGLRGPLVDVEVTVLDHDRHVLHINHDGLVIDGISMFLFFDQWHRCYETGTPPEPGQMDFLDHISRLEKEGETDRYERARRYWRDRLDEIPAAPDLPLAIDPSAVEQTRTTQRRVELDCDQWKVLRANAQAHGISDAAATLAAWSEVLSAWGAGTDFTINTTVSQRVPSHPKAMQAIGQFSDPMLLAVNWEPERTFGERALRLHQQWRSDLDHRHYSGVEVMRDLARHHGSARRGSAPYTFNCTLGAVGVDGGALEAFGPECFTLSQTPQVYLDVFVLESDDGLQIRLDAVEQLFSAGMLEAITEALQRLLVTLTDPNAWHQRRFDLLPASQRRARKEANDTQVTRVFTPLPEAFIRHADTDGDRPAILSSTGGLTYRELLERAAAAANWLIDQGISRGDRVALLMRRGAEQYVGIIATLLAGAVYVPIDADLPARRREFLLRDAGARAVLTNVEANNVGPSWDLRDAHTSSDVPRPDISEDDLSYLLYTSGTTGEPKGVMVNHGNVANVVADCAERFRITHHDRFFAVSAFTFDLSVWDVFGALSAGAALVVPDADRAADPTHWRQLASRHGATVWNSVPAIVRLLAEPDMALPAEERTALPESLRLIMMSGDRIPSNLPSTLYAQRPDLTVSSLGGPTETTIWNITHPIPVDHPTDEPIPYGRPNSNNRAHIRDRFGRDCPDWVPGEILAAGTGVTPGYWGAPEATARKYTFDEDSGERLFHTGDLGRYRPDGTIEILGRMDFQIKLNGYRIEAGDVETHLSACEGVAQAAVTAEATPGGGAVLTAHVVGNGSHRPSLRSIRDQLGRSVPDYMLPAQLVWHDHFPVNRNGKVDRTALSRGGQRSTDSPATETNPADAQVEKRLASLWAEAMGREDLDVTADFTEIGGDSITAVRILAAVRTQFGVTLPLDAMYALRTVRHMAHHLAKEDS